MELKEFWWHCQSESTKLGLWDPVAYAWELDACTAARPAIVSNQHGSFQTFVQVWSLCVRPKVKFANAAIQISYFNAKLNRHEVGSRCLEIWGHKAWNGGADWPKRQCLRFFLNFPARGMRFVPSNDVPSMFLKEWVGCNLGHLEIGRQGPLTKF